MTSRMALSINHVANAAAAASVPRFMRFTEGVMMTKSQQAEFERLKHDVERMSNSIYRLRNELKISQRVTELLFEDHGIYDDDRDAYYRRAKSE